MADCPDRRVGGGKWEVGGDGRGEGSKGRSSLAIDSRFAWEKKPGADKYLAAYKAKLKVDRDFSPWFFFE